VEVEAFEWVRGWRADICASQPRLRDTANLADAARPSCFSPGQSEISFSMKFRSATQADIAQICALERLPEFRTMVGSWAEDEHMRMLMLSTSLLKIDRERSPASRSCAGCYQSTNRWNSNASWCVLPTKA
jgi:hypothetical protein